jgi:phage terminase large subunit GpA-like protein
MLTPYVVEPERAAASGLWRRVVLVFGAQTGKSEAMLDVAGQRLDQRPGPILYVGPNKQFLTEQFEPRVMALLDEAPSLMDKVAASACQDAEGGRGRSLPFGALGIGNGAQV